METELSLPGSRDGEEPRPSQNLRSSSFLLTPSESYTIRSEKGSQGAKKDVKSKSYVEQYRLHAMMREGKMTQRKPPPKPTPSTPPKVWNQHQASKIMRKPTKISEPVRNINRRIPVRTPVTTGVTRPQRRDVVGNPRKRPQTGNSQPETIALLQTKCEVTPPVMMPQPEQSYDWTADNVSQSIRDYNNNETENEGRLRPAMEPTPVICFTCPDTPPVPETALSKLLPVVGDVREASESSMMELHVDNNNIPIKDTKDPSASMEVTVVFESTPSGSSNNINRKGSEIEEGADVETYTLANTKSPSPPPQCGSQREMNSNHFLESPLSSATIRSTKRGNAVTSPDKSETLLDDLFFPNKKGSHVDEGEPEYTEDRASDHASIEKIERLATPDTSPDDFTPCEFQWPKSSTSEEMLGTQNQASEDIVAPPEAFREPLPNEKEEIIDEEEEEEVVGVQSPRPVAEKAPTVETGTTKGNKFQRKGTSFEKPHKAPQDFKSRSAFGTTRIPLISGALKNVNKKPCHMPVKHPEPPKQILPPIRRPILPRTRENIAKTGCKSCTPCPKVSLTPPIPAKKLDISSRGKEKPPSREPLPIEAKVAFTKSKPIELQPAVKKRSTIRKLLPVPEKDRPKKKSKTMVKKQSQHGTKELITPPPDENQNMGENYISFSNAILMYKMGNGMAGIIRLTNFSHQGVIFRVSPVSETPDRYCIEPKEGRLGSRECFLVKLSTETFADDEECQDLKFKIETVTTDATTSINTRRFWMNPPESKVRTWYTLSTIRYHPNDPFFRACLLHPKIVPSEAVKPKKGGKVNVTLKEVLQDVEIARGELKKMAALEQFNFTIAVVFAFGSILVSFYHL